MKGSLENGSKILLESEMTHDPMVAEMKKLPPSRWAEVVRRAKVLRHYAAVPRPTVEDMRRCAAELGCGQRQAYYYVRAWRARSSGLPDPRSTKHARPTGLPTSVDVIGASQSDATNSYEYRTTLGSSAGSIAFDNDQPTRTQPDREIEIVVDCAPLAFDVDDAGTVEPARLLVAMGKADGRIFSHALLSHEATSIDAESVLLAWDGRIGAKVSWTAGIGDGFDFGHRAALAGAVSVPSGANVVPAGAAMLDLAGGSIGRIRIAPRRRASHGKPEAAVPIDAARTAVAHIVADYNDAIGLPEHSSRLA
jgi:hypothetical protein